MILCIDPGHGGNDPGAIGPSGLTEAEVNVFVGRLLAVKLAEYGHDVIMTRSGMQGISLSDRCHMSNQAKADLYVSLHCNSATNSSAHGSETWHYPGSSAGRAWAQRLQTALVRAGERRNRGIKEGRFDVLQGTKAPAVLLELAFISNPGEEQLLQDQEWLTRVADAIADEINRYSVQRYG
jgi:N-acetylmuramoyl-L-alanine amidase